MSIVTSAAGNPGQMTRPTWRVAVRRIETLIRQPPVVLGLAAAVAGAVFVLATPRVLPLLGGLVATLLIGAVGPWLSLLGMRGRLDFAAARCRLGDRVPHRVVVTRFGRATVPPRVDWSDGVGREVAAGVVVPARRGLFPGPSHHPAIVSDWPFGIATARRPLAVPRPLVVRPVTTPVRFPSWLVAARRPGRDSSMAATGAAGDIIGVRDYRPGDPSRSIHWPLTARRGELVVCERPGSAAARVRIVLVGDTAAARERSPGDAVRLDAAVAVASSLVESWSNRGADLDVAWSRRDGTAVEFRPRTREQLDETLDAVACLEEVGCWHSSCEQQGRGSLPSLPSLPKKGGRHLFDLEIRLAVGRGLRSAEFETSASTGIVVAFGPTEVPGAIVLPASPLAAGMLDQAFTEISHDPDVR
jgi:uncharacterized protein (DUF58 family)